MAKNELEIAAEWPLVTCILPTENRANFICHAINFFLLQDYPNKELIILYSKESDIPKNYDFPPSVSLICTGSLSLGAKRNFAINIVKGTFVAQWDDDDIYHPSRLSAQISPLLNDGVDITGLQNILFYEVESERTWAPTAQQFMSMFDGNVACGTIIFKREIWGKLTQYPDVDSAEDGFFLVQAIRNGAILKEVDGRDLYIYVRHGSNTWKFHNTIFRNRARWHQEIMPPWALQFESFYKDKQLFYNNR